VLGNFARPHGISPPLHADLHALTLAPLLSHDSLRCFTETPSYLLDHCYSINQMSITNRMLKNAARTNQKNKTHEMTT
jgi:hypothetical protein